MNLEQLAHKAERLGLRFYGSALMFTRDRKLADHYRKTYRPIFDDARYIRDEQDLIGYHKPLVFVLGPYWQHRRGEQIREMLKHCDAVEMNETAIVRVFGQIVLFMEIAQTKTPGV